MKYLLSCGILLLFSFTANSQVSDTVRKPIFPFNNNWEKMMETDPADKWFRFSSANQSFQLFERLAKPLNKSAAVTGYHGNAILSWLNGQDFFELAAAGITKANADSFLYHVVVNDSFEIVPWQHPSTFHSNKNGTYAYLGKFTSINKLIKLEIYHTGQYYDKKMLYFNNLYTPKPEIAHATLFYNDRYLSRPHQQHYIPRSKQSELYGYTVTIPKNLTGKEKLSKLEINHQSFEWSDSINHIKVSMKPTLLNEMYHVYLRHFSNQQSDTILISNKWNLSSYSKNPELMINAADFKRPGNYEVIIRAEVPEEFKHNTLNAQASFFFTVKPSAIVQFSPKQAIMYTAFLAFIGGTGFFYYRGRSRRQLEKKKQEKQIVSLQLQAVRSQLNPHFMFNSLSGIQNLMHKNETTKAGNYLSRFARITRHILKASDKEMTGLEEEINLMNDYLLMEQLRFGFQYTITVDDTIDRLHTDIPAMLLQPLVENAVKHAVSALGAEGNIEIGFTRKEQHLVIYVKDNGKGFTQASVTEGHGLKLTRDRIHLLNTLYPENPIHFDIVLSKDGCICKTELNNWL
ncbi:sensor histidine kinase [Sediminibacterium goheungense]|uniref:Histidine kinase n=1 Tax=Sediminibacterium goheungense TaxID=1086393 RepID=A0A4R6IZP5_9BACT|nr:histidine kinase [Sediminibacterium goheungense]TDO27977.1 histidine kinase [Sediminibacterium goheungense]